MSKLRRLILGVIIFFGVFGGGIILIPEREKTMADETKETFEYFQNLSLPIVEKNTFLPRTEKPFQVVKKIKVIVTGYSSSIWETQGDPFITAWGTRVRTGIVANNLLPFGQKIRLPEIFGDRIFVVEDRMNSKKSPYHVDIWFPSREEALKFGFWITEMEILN